MSTNYSEIELTDQEIDEYLTVALSAKTVTPAERKKLAPLMKFYAKKPHPFTACVKDNRKRFGAKTEAYCAVLKDLIVGNTKWRHGGNHTAKGAAMSQEMLVELYQIDPPEGFSHWLSELETEEINAMMVTDEENDKEIVFAAGDVVWKPSEGFSEVRREVERALREKFPKSNSLTYSETDYYYVEDISNNKALVANGSDYYVVNFTQDEKGKVNIPDKTDWISVEKAWIDEGENLSQDDQIMAEMFFAATAPATKVKADKDGLIWKTILREGKWKYSPGANGIPNAKSITVVMDGKSDSTKKIISMSELKKNFEDGAIEHVTIPTSHADSVLENTGFVKKLRFGTDENGRNVLEAGHSFTEPDVKDKAERGTIANTSAGILFDYIHKESGKKFRSVLAHVALTNRPWLNGMKPFGVNASENVSIMGFAEEINDDPAEVGGGDNSMSETAFDFSTLGFASEDELKAALAERAEMKTRERERDVADLCQKWQGEGKTPALVAEAKAILMSDEGSNVVNLSEDGKTVALSASDIVKRLVEKAAAIDLTQEVVTDKDLSGEEAPEDEEVELSQEEKALVTQLFFSGYTGKDAVVEAKRRVADAAVTK